MRGRLKTMTWTHPDGASVHETEKCMSQQAKESVSVVTGDVVEVQSSFFHHEGTNDYTNTKIEVVEIVDRDGRSLQPVWPAEWTALADGVETRGDHKTRSVRIFARACPVRVRFLNYREYVSYTDEEHSSSSTSHAWVRYVASGAAPAG
jgi:hypothetical protein